MNTLTPTCLGCHVFPSPEEINCPDYFKEIFLLSDSMLKTTSSVKAALKGFIADSRGH